MTHRGGPVNELLPFLDFIQHHPVGSSVSGVVESYSSHGAYVTIGDVRGYVPLRLMGTPPPRSAREVMKQGEAVTLVVDSFAPARRSVDLSLPGASGHVVAAAPEEPAPAPAPAAKRKRVAGSTAAADRRQGGADRTQGRSSNQGASGSEADAQEGRGAGQEGRNRPAGRRAEQEGGPAKKAPAKKAPAKKIAAKQPPSTAPVDSAAPAVAKRTRSGRARKPAADTP